MKTDSAPRRHPREPLATNRIVAAAMAVLILGVGLILADDYGISTDEVLNAKIGELAVRSYVSAQALLDYLRYGSVLAHHGPSYFMLQFASSKIMPALLPSWSAADGRHFANFMAFALGMVSFNALASRLMRKSSALVATLFFALQPLVFGHAFINQKDTPFLGFFLATVALGMIAADRWLADSRTSQADLSLSLPRLAAQEWRASSRKTRTLGWVSLAGAVALLLFLFVTSPALSVAKEIVRQAYEGRAWPPLQSAFDRLAQDAHKTPLDAYLLKASWAYWMGRVVITTMAAVLGAVVLKRVFPTTTREGWRSYGRSLMLAAAAGILLGITVSIRPIGGLAGVLVSLYWIYRMGLRGLGALAFYWLVAAITCYLTWPYLWPWPAEGFLESLGFAAAFPAHSTLFQGRIVSSKDLPAVYFPVLTAIELTEPVLPLAVAGVVVAVSRLRKRRMDAGVAAVLACWLLIPLTGLYGLGMGIYGNIRQLLFVLPPIFLASGLGIAWLLSLLRRVWMQSVLVGCLLAPGLIGIISLHPYEYTYFNSLVGGASGAAGWYEQDRFCTSYREAMAFVNAQASAGDLVVVYGAPQAASPYARDDIQVVASDEIGIEDGDYLLTCKFWLGGDFSEDGFEKVFDVRRGSAVYAEVYRREAGN
jgi:hypothetical protein